MIGQKHNSITIVGEPVPSILEISLGCLSAKRYVLFFAYNNGSTVAWTDGIIAVQVYWPAWLVYSSSAYMFRLLKAFPLNGFQDPCLRWLELDRCKRCLSIVNQQRVLKHFGKSIHDLDAITIEGNPYIENAIALIQELSQYVHQNDAFSSCTVSI